MIVMILLIILQISGDAIAMRDSGTTEAGTELKWAALTAIDRYLHTLGSPKRVQV